MTITISRPRRSLLATVASVRRVTVVLLAVCLAGGARVTLAQAGTQEIDARIAQLRRSFECLDVESVGGFVCSMKDGLVGSLSRKRIEPVVTSSGTIFLRSVYRDRDWIYHDHVVVRVGEQEYVSDALPPTSADVTRRETRRQSSSDRRRGRYDEDRYISESVRYRAGSDNGIVRAIAEAGDAKVTMRLAGGPRVFDKTLSNDEKRIFAEAMELATLLRRRATPATGDTSKKLGVDILLGAPYRLPTCRAATHESERHPCRLTRYWSTSALGSRVSIAATFRAPTQRSTPIASST